jgi:phosphatidylinositol phospholipase C delta
MTAPLSHYFIYTGHNSYLTGNQLSSDCSDEPIIRALKRGVRGIELDIWPNKTKDDVVVLHGRTLTTPVKFIKCIKSIKEHAFDESDYPVIITLEDHLTTELQAKAAKMITETFGNMLFYIEDLVGFKEFPSPESLKRRILISTKPPKECLERQSSADLEDGDKNEEKHPEEEPSEDETDNEDVENDEKSLQGAGSAEEDLDDVNGVVQVKAEVPVYKKLISIHAEKKTGFPLRDTLRFDGGLVKRISLSEPKFEKLAKSHPTDIVRFSQTNILKIYPKLTRVTSSNFNPLIAFLHGAQMVAFNMQGYGRNLWLVHGFFRANGGCGYVKKPEFLLRSANNDGDNDQNTFDPKVQRPLKTTLKVKVYMGDGWRYDFNKTHFDTYSPPDFYTKIWIAGVTADSKMLRTHAIVDNWIPCWDREFTFPLTVQELALLRIQVNAYNMPEKDVFGGQTCLPVAELKPGIRSIPLFNKKGEKYKSVKLLLRIEFL